MEHDTEADPGPTTPEPSGEPRVDAALRRLSDLDSLPVSDHPPVFERIHGQLVEVLGELHAGPDGADGGADHAR